MLQSNQKNSWTEQVVSRVAIDGVEVARKSIHAAQREASAIDLSWIQPPSSDEGWTLAPDALRFITSLIGKLKPRHVLEFGSGLSTQVLARATAELSEPAAVSSVDHDPKFAATLSQTYQTLAHRGCQVSIQIAPIVARKYCDKWVPVYLWEAERFASQEPLDLVVIDGPPAALGGREGTLYQAMDLAHPGTVVLLDDAIRSEEQAALRHWQDNYGTAIEVIQLPNFIRGLAAIIVVDAIPMKDLFDHRLKITRTEVHELLQPSDKCLIAGDDWYRNELAGDYHTLPFLECDGENWGSPPDDSTAISELERLRSEGAKFIVFGAPFFWWLEHYKVFNRHLRARFDCVLANDRIIIFDLDGVRANSAVCPKLA